MGKTSAFCAEEVLTSVVHARSRLSDVLLVLAVAPSPVLLTNLASLALVLAVRRQVIEGETGTLSLGERSADRKRLQAAEHALIVDSVFVGVWSTVLIIASLWTAIYLRNSAGSDSSFTGERPPLVPLALPLTFSSHPQA